MIPSPVGLPLGQTRPAEAAVDPIVRLIIRLPARTALCPKAVDPMRRPDACPDSRREVGRLKLVLGVEVRSRECVFQGVFIFPRSHGDARLPAAPVTMLMKPSLHLRLPQAVRLVPVVEHLQREGHGWLSVAGAD